MPQDASGGTYRLALRELAFQLCPSFWDFAWCFSCPATRFENPLRNFFPLVTAPKSLPQNKKPGVERRVQPPTPEWLHALLDFFLPCTRKEPHYWI